MKNISWLPALLILLAMGGIGIVACSDQGPAEQAGEQIDETTEDVYEGSVERMEELDEQYEELQEEYEQWRDEHEE